MFGTIHTCHVYYEVDNIFLDGHCDCKNAGRDVLGVNYKKG